MSYVASRRKFAGRVAQEGFALLAVLWAIVLLSVLAMALFDAVRVESQGTLYEKEATQAFALARGGIDAATFELAYPSGTGAEESSFWKWRPGQRDSALSFGGGKVELHIVNAAGLVDINEASSEQLRRLLEARGLEASEARQLAGSILEWRSPPKSGQDTQSPDQASQGRAEASAPPHRPFRSLEEILRLPGMTREIFYGTVELGRDGKLHPRYGVGQDLTVFSNSAQINVNYASEQVLESVPGITFELARTIVEERARGPFSSIDDVGQRLGSPLPDESLPYLTTAASQTYYIIATAQMEGSRVRRSVEAVVQLVPQGLSPYRLVAWYDDYTWLGN